VYLFTHSRNDDLHAGEIVGREGGDVTGLAS